MAIITCCSEPSEHIHEAAYNLLAPFLAELQASFRALESHPYNTFASYDPCGSDCSLASFSQNIPCFPFYMNFKTVAKIVFFIQATLRCIGGLPLKMCNILSSFSPTFPYLFVPFAELPN